MIIPVRVRWSVIIAVLACSVAFAICDDLVPRVTRIDVGDDRNGGLLGGFTRAEVIDGRTGRWTDTAGEIRFRHVGPFPATVRIRLAGCPDGETKHVGFLVNHVEIAKVSVNSALETIELPVRQGTYGADLIIGIQPIGEVASSRSHSPRVFVDNVELRTGGRISLAPGAWPHLIWATLLFAGILTVTSWTVRRLGHLPWLAAAGIIITVGGLVLLGLVLWRFETIHLLPKMAILSGLTACAIVAMDHPSVRPALEAMTLHMEKWSARPMAFLVLGIALVIGLLGIDVLRGHVLSAADTLYLFYPWKPYTPDDIIAPRNRLLGDIPRQFYPFLSYARTEVLGGTLPLWNPGMYTGHPFVASMASAVFSPFTAIAYIIPLPYATVFIAAAILLTGGIGMFVFVRSLGLRWPAATFAGMAWLVNPFSVIWLEHYTVPSNAAWLPWTLWASDLVVRRRHPKHVVVLAVFVGLILLSGHPETSLKCLILAGLYGIARLISTKQGFRGFGVLTMGYACGLLLAAVQILPFLEYMRESWVVRLRGDTSINRLFASFDTIITMVVPNFWGNPSAIEYLVTTNRYGYKASYADQFVYPGIAAWILAGVGLVWGWRDARIKFFAIIGATCALVMYGTPGILQIVSAVPLLNVTRLALFGIVTLFAVIILSSFGMEALTRPTGLGIGGARPRTNTLWIPAAVVAAVMVMTVIVFTGWHRVLLETTGHLASVLRYASVAIGMSVAALTFIILRARGTLTFALFVPGMLALLAADLLFMGRGYHPLIEPEKAFPRLPEIQAVKDDPDLFRVGGWEWALFPNVGLAYGLQDFRGYDGMGLARYDTLLHARFDAYSEAHHGNVFHALSQFEHSSILDLLNVKYVFGDPRAILPEDHYSRLDVGRAPLYRNNRVFPRAFLVDNYRVKVDDEAIAILHDGSVDLHRYVLLEQDPPSDERPEPTVLAEGPGMATVMRYAGSHVEIRTQSTGPRMLVLTDLYYPGWQALVDGRPAPIYRANYAFRGVPVPGGAHVVEFRYRPLSFLTGAIISGLTLLGLIGWWAGTAWTKRVTPGS
jgi:Bacterial membrane protein YfhO